MERTTTTSRKFAPFFNVNGSPQGRGGQIDWSRLGLEYQGGKFNVQLSAAAAADATSVSVDALPYPLKKGTVLQSGADEYITVTDDVDAGETSIPVEAITTALEDNDVLVANMGGGTSNARWLPVGTIMARSAEAGKEHLLIPRAVASGGETASEILRSDAFENSKSAAKTGYGTIVGGGIYENLCPDANGSGDVSGTYKTELATNGCTFQWFDFVDDRTS